MTAKLPRSTNPLTLEEFQAAAQALIVKRDKELSKIPQTDDLRIHQVHVQYNRSCLALVDRLDA